MPGERENGPQVQDLDAIRAEWLERLNTLAAQVKGWVESAGWRTRIVSKPTRDSELGRFEVPLLLMEKDGVEVALNPVSRFVTGSEGAVDLYVVPAYDDIASLYLFDGKWTIRDPSWASPALREAQDLPPEELPLSEESILRVLGGMTVLGD